MAFSARLIAPIASFPSPSRMRQWETVWASVASLGFPVLELCEPVLHNSDKSLTTLCSQGLTHNESLSIGRHVILGILPF